KRVSLFKVSNPTCRCIKSSSSKSISKLFRFYLKDVISNGNPIPNCAFDPHRHCFFNVRIINLSLMLSSSQGSIVVVSEFGTCLSSEPSHSVQDSVVSVQNPDTQSRTQSSQSRTETGPQLRYNISKRIHALELNL